MSLAASEVAPKHSIPGLAPLLPGPRFLGHGTAFRLRPLQFLFDATAAGDVVRLRFPIKPHMAHVLRHPDHVRHVLVDNARNYGKQTRGYLRLREILGDGLVTSEGDFWRRQRRIANPAFHHERIARFGDTMVRCAQEMVESWAPRIAAKTPFDLSQEMTRVTLRIIGLTMLSAEVSGSASVVREALDHVLHIALARTLGLLVPPLYVPTVQTLRFRRSRKALDAVVAPLIADRRRAPKDHGDLLSMLMDARDPETGEGMSDRQLRDEAMTMFLAGHETTANALSWTFYLLARHPDVERDLRAEVREVLGDRAATLADLPRLTLTERVIKESMRLYPPVWVISRSVVADDVIGGYQIPQGSLLFLSPMVTHRDERFWPDPDRFDPNRFAPEQESARPKAAYLPFSLGPRKCIGETFASMEARLILATLLQRATLVPVSDRTVEPEPTITLRPKGGVWMTARSA